MYTMRIETPSHDEHYRTTLLSGEGGRLFAYVEIKHAVQLTHTHHFAELTRFGEATCHGCGAGAWSPFWVAEGVFGEQTESWMHERQRIALSLLFEPVGVAQVHLGAEIIHVEPRTRADLERECIDRGIVHRCIGCDLGAIRTSYTDVQLAEALAGMLRLDPNPTHLCVPPAPVGTVRTRKMLA